MNNELYDCFFRFPFQLKPMYQCQFVKRHVKWQRALCSGFCMCVQHLSVPPFIPLGNEAGRFKFDIKRWIYENKLQQFRIVYYPWSRISDEYGICCGNQDGIHFGFWDSNNLQSIIQSLMIKFMTLQWNGCFEICGRSKWLGRTFSGNTIFIGMLIITMNPWTEHRRAI